jgi:hypothetical protein
MALEVPMEIRLTALFCRSGKKILCSPVKDCHLSRMNTIIPSQLCYGGKNPVMKYTLDL